MHRRSKRSQNESNTISSEIRNDIESVYILPMKAIRMVGSDTLVIDKC